MFGKITKVHGPGLIEAQIISSDTPAAMPTTSDGIDNLGDGYTLAPGSTMIVTGTDKQYILGDDGTWEEYSAGGGGDLSAYQEKILSSPVTIGAETATTVEGAIGATADVVPSTATEQNKLATAADVTGEDIVATATGTAITVTDSVDARVQNIQIFGHTESGSSVGDNGLAVTLKGKNLFNINGEVSMRYDNTLGWVEDTAWNKNEYYLGKLIARRNMSVEKCDGQLINVVAGETYTLSLIPVYKDDGSSCCVAIGYVEEGTHKILSQTIWTQNFDVVNSITFIAPSNEICIEFGTSAEGTQARFRDIQLEKSSFVTSYEPYNLSTLSVTTGLPLRSNGDVKDDVNFAAGIVTKRIDTDGMVLATPTEVSLSATEINAFRALKTYAGIISITATDSPTMNFSYLKNTDNGKAVAAVQDDAQKQINDKQDALTFDSTPTENSSNPVTSGGVYDALQGAGGGSKLTFLGGETVSSSFKNVIENADLSNYDYILWLMGYDEATCISPSFIKTTALPSHTFATVAYYYASSSSTHSTRNALLQSTGIWNISSVTIQAKVAGSGNSGYCKIFGVKL